MQNGYISLVVMVLIAGPAFAAGPEADPDGPAKSPPTAGAVVRAPWSADEARAFALDHSPRMAVAAAQRDLALAKLIPSRPHARPDIEITGTQSLQGPEVSLPLLTGPDEVLPLHEQQLAIMANQVLYHPGRGANQARVDAEVRAAAEDYADVQGSVAHDALAAFYQAREAEEGEAVALQAAADVQRNVDNVRTLMQAGRAVQLDLLTAESALGQAAQQAIVATNGRKIAEANFNRTAGQPLTAAVALTGTDTLPGADAPVDDAIQVALKTRPDILRQQAEVDSARQALALARLENGPTLSAHAGYSLQTPTALQRTTEWQIRAEVSLPLLQSAQQQSDVEQSRAGLDAAEAGLRAQRDAATLQVFSAWQDLQTARAQLITADQPEVDAEQEALRAAGLRRQVGEASESDIARARIKLSEAVSKLTQDRYNVVLRLVDLQFQTGVLSGNSMPAPAGPAPAGPAPAGPAPR